jgi:hypothetical protein
MLPHIFRPRAGGGGCGIESKPPPPPPPPPPAPPPPPRRIESKPTPPPAISHGIAVLAHTLRKGLIWQYVKPNRTVESVVISSILSRKTNRLSLFRHDAGEIRTRVASRLGRDSRQLIRTVHDTSILLYPVQYIASIAYMCYCTLYCLHTLLRYISFTSILVVTGAIDCIGYKVFS